jgi:hypothetical protein
MFHHPGLKLHRMAESSAGENLGQREEKIARSSPDLGRLSLFKGVDQRKKAQGILKGLAFGVMELGGMFWIKEMRQEILQKKCEQSGSNR